MSEQEVMVKAMSKPLPPAEAKLRMDITKALGRAMALTDRAFVSVLHNRRRTALRQVGAVYAVLDVAASCLEAWSAKKAKRRARQVA